MNPATYPVAVDDSGARHLIAGTRLPDIALEATRGAPVTLARFQERCVIVIYPMTGTPGRANPPDWDVIPGAHGSTPELEGFRDAYDAYQLLGYEIFGLSGQSRAEQTAFSQRVGLPFQLISDANLAFADALSLPRFETGQVSYLKRLTMVVRNGVIYRTYYPVLSPEAHAREVLDTLNASLS